MKSQDPSQIAYMCHTVGHINSKGLWFGDNPLSFSLPLLLLQFSLISIFSRSIYILLKPFGQPLVVSHVLGGIILGPSILGHYLTFAEKVFPPNGATFLDTISGFGFMLFLFQIGVKIDPTMALKSGKRALSIGVLAFFVPYALAGLVAIILNYSSSLDDDISTCLSTAVTMQPMTAFPVIACFLAEFKILNSEIGHLASSSSMICDLCHWFVVTLKFVAKVATEKSLTISMGFLLSSVLLVIMVVFGIRPAALWVIQHTPEGEPVKEGYIISVLLALMGCGLLGEVIGLNAFVAAFFFGLVIPDGPPLGAALVERLECIVSVLFMPIFFAKCGLRMNVFAIKNWENVGFIELVIFVAFFGKVVGAILPPLLWRMPFRDALSLGLIMNSKGIIELALLNDLKVDNVISEECFAIMIISVLVVTGLVSPMVKILYDPSRRFIAYRRRTIRHHRQSEELRILACIHGLDNVQAMMTLLNASNATSENPIVIYVLHLIKLVGRASSVLTAHLPPEKPSQNPTQSDRIFDAFRKFEQLNGHLTAHCYKGISPYATMHNDVCSLALDHRISLIIIPYQKQRNGGRGSDSSRVYKHLNNNVFDKAPCSVGVLVDRGKQRKTRHRSEGPSLFRVGVLFFGGADDREALAYAIRMSEQSNVLVTLICFISAPAEIVGGTVRSKMLDTEIISELKVKVLHNERVFYREERVMDGKGLVDVIRSVENASDLVMVGRRHAESRLISDLRKSNEYQVLGTIGEMLATADNFIGRPSVLVVQQQTRVWGLRDPEESTHLRKIKL